MRGPLRRLLFPDDKIGWLPGAVRRGLEAIRRGARVVWTTSPPESGHLAGWILKRITGRPWVMDYNVEWSTNPATAWRSERERARHRALEAFLLRRADAVCSLSARHLERLPAAARSVVVEAGYDGERFRPTPRPAWRLDRPFVVTHTGSLFGVQQPEAFVRAVNELVEQGAIPADRIVARFIGNLWEGAEPLARAKFRVETSTPIPYEEVPARLAESDALLVTLSAEAECVVPNKLYEYMASGRPVLAIAPEGNPVTATVRRTRCGIAADPSDPAAVRAAVRALYEGRVPYEPAAEEIARFEVRRTIGKLAALFDDLAA
jgi:glycosyltransferase involved in cell wall biosynthesis